MMNVTRAAGDDESDLTIAQPGSFCNRLLPEHGRHEHQPATPFDIEYFCAEVERGLA